MLQVQTNFDKAHFSELPKLMNELHNQCSHELIKPECLKMRPKVLSESDIHPAIREAKLFGLRRRGDWHRIDSFMTDQMSESNITSSVQSPTVRSAMSNSAIGKRNT